MNYALSDIPEDRIRYHVCWGSWNAPHTSDVPLKTLIDLILQSARAGLSDRSGQSPARARMEVWKDVKLPDGKILVPGLVSSFDECRRASRTGAVAHQEFCQSGRPRKRDRWNRLRVLSELEHRPRSPLDSMGQARSVGRRRSARQLRLVAACIGPRRQASGVYSVLMLASFTTRLQRSISAAINVRNSSGVLGFDDRLIGRQVFPYVG